MTVIDLGGTVESWLVAPVRPSHVTVVNLEPSGVSSDWITTIQADACCLPNNLQKATFDLVFSNSLIEHVGGHTRRQQLADTVAGLADRHWVQTPYRYFPIEPHWLFPFFASLPLAVQGAILERWHVSGWWPADHAEAVANAMSIELLTRTQMKHYFPHSRLVSERFKGLTKSVIAVRDEGEVDLSRALRRP